MYLTFIIINIMILQSAAPKSGQIIFSKHKFYRKTNSFYQIVCKIIQKHIYSIYLPLASIKVSIFDLNR